MRMKIAQIPRAELNPLFLDLGVISSDVKRDITLTNTGQVSMIPKAPFLHIYESNLWSTHELVCQLGRLPRYALPCYCQGFPHIGGAVRMQSYTSNMAPE